MAEKWVQKMHMKKGALHSMLGVPQGEKIPAGKLAANSGDSTLLAKRKSLARTMSKFKH